MPAPDFDTLYNPETFIEAAFKSIAQTALGNGVAVITTFADVDRSTPRVEITASITGETGTFRKQSDERQVRLVWNMQVAVDVVTDRKKPAQVNRTLCAKLRRAFLLNGSLLGELSPYHAVSDIRHTGSAAGVNEADEDVSSLTWVLSAVHIRNSAWPEA